MLYQSHDLNTRSYIWLVFLKTIIWTFGDIHNEILYIFEPSSTSSLSPPAKEPLLYHLNKCERDYASAYFLLNTLQGASLQLSPP